MEFYKKAQAALGDRRTYPEVWDSVSLDISGTYVGLCSVLFVMAPVFAAVVYLHSC